VTAEQPTKTCNKCKRRKPRRDFFLGIVKLDGAAPKLEVSPFCETCRTTRESCELCGEAKPICEFTRRSSEYGWCKVCHEEIRQRFYRAMAVAIRAATAREIPAGSLWYDQDPKETARLPSRRRRQRLNAASKERIDRAAIFERDAWMCGICGLPVAPEDASLDHIVPVSLGGPHTATNLRLAHTLCNSRRGDRPDLDG
jgi:hypothetical protein